MKARILFITLLALSIFGCSDDSFDEFVVDDQLEVIPNAPSDSEPGGGTNPPPCKCQ